MSIVRKIIVTICEDDRAAGYYEISSYVIGDQGVVPGVQFYNRLSWQESSDIVSLLLDENQPGRHATQAATDIHLW